VGPHGVPGQKLDEAAIRALEPALTGRLAGGVYFPTEAHAEPLTIVRALAEKARAAGAKILERTEVYDFEVSDRRVTGVRTTHGMLSADQYVLATGSWSQRLGRMLRLRVPVLGGKGYAIIVPPFEPGPRHPMMLIEKKIAVTPREGTVRLAGTLELVNQDLSITRRRVDAIVRGAREFMNVPAEPQMIELWRGLRPCTPDGVPIIGRSPHHSNLVLATGHQMLGLQSAPGTGRLVGDIICGGTPTFALEPFSAGRF
jgi:D-amino-acid dehydrogenase